MMTALGSGIDIFLHPGEWYFGDEHTRIRTLLGSCVAVTLWHPGYKVGGMCHFMLPGKHHPRTELNARYGTDALALLVREMHRHGGRPGDYEAKLFGGSSMFGLGPAANSVADRNICMAEDLVRIHGLKVVARSLGGSVYRQLVFDLGQGDVWMRLGEPSAHDRCLASGASA
ncbi:chemotaxis protein CheD [Halopseudomonas sp.]|uniref:chemotaxis protein CheD n=1 Tax=Halopseudomonas sp. TaxID=2901191 RepID=UPI001A55A138|nr:chemotaxis protein CheD [Pseudomonas sp.]|tara:strand:- start:9306 stop:9821 length:516 start_codon:yes stop_codon:yes gene_type:complete